MQWSIICKTKLKNNGISELLLDTFKLIGFGYLFYMMLWWFFLFLFVFFCFCFFFWYAASLCILNNVFNLSGLCLYQNTIKSADPNNVFYIHFFHDVFLLPWHIGEKKFDLHPLGQYPGSLVHVSLPLQCPHLPSQSLMLS